MSSTVPWWLWLKAGILSAACVAAGAVLVGTGIGIAAGAGLIAKRGMVTAAGDRMVMLGAIVAAVSDFTQNGVKQVKAVYDFQSAEFPSGRDHPLNVTTLPPSPPNCVRPKELKQECSHYEKDPRVDVRFACNVNQDDPNDVITLGCRDEFPAKYNEFLNRCICIKNVTFFQECYSFHRMCNDPNLYFNKTPQVFFRCWPYDKNYFGPFFKIDQHTRYEYEKFCDSFHLWSNIRPNKFLYTCCAAGPCYLFEELCSDWHLFSKQKPRYDLDCKRPWDLTTDFTLSQHVTFEEFKEMCRAIGPDHCPQPRPPGLFHPVCETTLLCCPANTTWPRPFRRGDPTTTTPTTPAGSDDLSPACYAGSLNFSMIIALCTMGLTFAIPNIHKKQDLTRLQLVFKVWIVFFGLFVLTLLMRIICYAVPPHYPEDLSFLVEAIPLMIVYPAVLVWMKVTIMDWKNEKLTFNRLTRWCRRRKRDDSEEVDDSDEYVDARSR